MSARELIIEGARQNNLKNISLRLPHNMVIAVTGVSGSGKSSLAFDTVFAEGHWRFIESLSTYARLFLEKLDRPDVEGIFNIRPAIALEQKNPVRASRSTVGTLTELYDLFRLLYAKIGTPHCPNCGKEIRKWDPSQIVSELLERHQGKRAVILFETKEVIEDLRKRGFQRLWVENETRDIGELTGAETPPSGASADLPLMVVLDRLMLRDDPRLSDSVEMAWREGNGRLKVGVFGENGKPEILGFSCDNECEECAITFPEPSAILFSFNHPIGACPECKGFGNTLTYAEDLIIPDPELSLRGGAVDPWNKPAYRWWKRQLLDRKKNTGLPLDKPYSEFTAEEKALLFKGSPSFYGINDFFEDLENRRYKLHVRVFLSRYRRAVTCPSCRGSRLKQEALSYKVAGLDIAALCGKSVSGLWHFFQDIDISPFSREVSKELLRQIGLKLDFLNRVGLDYLTLDRYGKTLSGGEYQRINLSNQLASLLTGTLYVLDEPTVGLHARDTERIAAIMRQLSDLGNTVIVVEHDRGIIESAGWIVELGPGGGHKGGEVIFNGPPPEFSGAGTLTSRYMKGTEKVGLPLRKRNPSEKRISVYGARGNNLRGIDLHIPLHRLTAITGVSGSGKSSLVSETLYPALARKFKTGTEPPLAFGHLEGENLLKGVKLIDQSPIGRSPRSNPVTYLKIFDAIRKLFAEQREARSYGYGPGFFSFNVPGGRCETCKGEGYELMEMYFFEDLYIRCEKCEGRRYRPEALRIQYRGKNIADVLDMTVEEAWEHFLEEPQVRSKLQLMLDTGLGYLRLGQPATTLSGGEAQRLKICAEMGTTARGDYLYILDEPTVGLHFSDVQALLNILDKLVETGNTVVVIEHNLDVIRAADWIIDIGPEGGDKGGTIIAEGTPRDISKTKGSHTGRYLSEQLRRG